MPIQWTNPTNSLGYMNNPNLRPAKYKYNYTREELKEFIRCQRDPIYFIENYVKIIDVAGNIVLPVLFEYQKVAIRTYLTEKMTIVMQPRQTAKSTTVAMLFVWYLIFEPNKVSSIMANKEKVAKEIMGRVKFSYENLPWFLQQGVESFSKTEIHLENNSRLFAGATSPSGIRGFTVTGILMLDEYAHVDANKADAFFSSVYPTISQPGSEAKLIISSTPKGFNHFYKIWNDAENGKMPFKTLRVTWQEVPGRDETWAKKELEVLGDLLFAQEVECSFLGSAQTLISSYHIRTLSMSPPIIRDHQLTIYEEPIEKHRYIIVCDPSRGTGNDYSAFVVFDVSEYPIRVVAKFQDNKVTPTELPMILLRLAYRYNSADVLIEINDNGEQIATTLFYDLEYENTITFGVKAGVLQVGIRTTKSVKAVGCQSFKELLEAKKLLIPDEDIIEEISHFVLDKTSFKAETGYHDDLVMCCVLFSWFASTSFFTDLFDINYRSELIKEKEAMIENQLLPFGIIDDGLNDSDDEDDDEMWKTPAYPSIWSPI